LTSASSFGVTRRNNTHRRLNHLPSHELAPSGHETNVVSARVSLLSVRTRRSAATPSCSSCLRCNLVAKTKASATFGLQHFSHTDKNSITHGLLLKSAHVMDLVHF
jgi:hypothetical protein